MYKLKYVIYYSLKANSRVSLTHRSSPTHQGIVLLAPPQGSSAPANSSLVP